MSQKSECNLESLSDEELMGLYQNGNAAAFEVLYRRHSPKVFGFLRAKLGKLSGAEDVLQACFLKLHTSRTHYDPSFSFSPWLFTICRSVLIDHIRKEKRSLDELDPEYLETLPMPQEIPSSVDIDLLTPKQRLAVEMRYNEGLSFNDISKRIETSPANVRQIVSRAIRILRGKV